MFQIILNCILKRYTLQELSVRYGVNLPDPHVNAALVKKAHGQSAIKGSYYEVNNTNKFNKRPGEKVSATLLDEDKAIVLKGQLGLLARFIAWLMSFVHAFIQKITDFFNSLIPKVPDNFKKIAAMLDKPYIKRMVIGHFTLKNNLSGTVVLPNNVVTSTQYEVRKNLLGSEKLYIVIQESNAKASLADKYFWPLIIPHYFVNRQTVFVTDPNNLPYFESIYN